MVGVDESSPVYTDGLTNQTVRLAQLLDKPGELSQ